MFQEPVEGLAESFTHSVIFFVQTNPAVKRVALFKGATSESHSDSKSGSKPEEQSEENTEDHSED